MEIGGKITKEKNIWLIEIPYLDLMTQSKTKKEIPDTVKEAIELLVDDSKFCVTVDVSGDYVFVKANDLKKLIAFMLKRLRLKNQLRLEDIASNLKAKSINEYAQYEQAKSLPSIEKLQEFLNAIEPNRQRHPLFF